jgi:hypothetical protein
MKKAILIIGLILISCFLFACGPTELEDYNLSVTSLEDLENQVEELEELAEKLGIETEDAESVASTNSEGEWRGYTRLTEMHDFEGKYISVDYYSEEVLKYNAEEDALVIVSRERVYDSLDNTNLDMGALGTIEFSIIGSGELTQTFDVDEGLIRFGFNTINEGYILTDPYLNNERDVWVTYDNNGEFTEEADALGSWLARHDLNDGEMDVDYIAGEFTTTINNGYGDGEVKVEFEYTFYEE